MKRLIIVVIAFLFWTAWSLADTTIMDRDGKVIANCHTFGRVTTCEEPRPSPYRLVSGNSANYLIGWGVTIKNDNSLGYSSPEIAFQLTRVALTGNEPVFKMFLKDLIDKGFAGYLVGGKVWRALETHDFYRAPLVRIQSMDGKEKYWIATYDLEKK
jgi:hypothetical protein